MKLQHVLASGAFVAVATVIGLASGGTASALTAVANGGFEASVVTEPYVTLNEGSAALDGWQITSGSIDHIGDYWQEQSGSQSIDLSGNEAGTISQTLSTIPGHTYEVGFYLAGNPDGEPTVKSVRVSADAEYEIFTSDVTPGSLETMNWTSKTFEFTATSTSTVLSFASLNAGAYGPALDSVTVSDVLTTKEQCKNGGWVTYSSPSFKNQGDCVSYAQSSEKAVGNRADNQ